MENTDLRTWVEARIMACDTCGSMYESLINGEDSDFIEETPCIRSFCSDGTIKSISPLLLPSVTLLNIADLLVVDSYINNFFPHHVNIVVKFRDIYGSQSRQLFKAPPMGYELALDSMPNDSANTPRFLWELSKLIEIRGKSDCGILEEIQSSINDLHAWAKACCNESGNI